MAWVATLLNPGTRNKADTAGKTKRAPMPVGAMLGGGHDELGVAGAPGRQQFGAGAARRADLFAIGRRQSGGIGRRARAHQTPVPHLAPRQT